MEFECDKLTNIKSQTVYNNEESGLFDNDPDIHFVKNTCKAILDLTINTDSVELSKNVADTNFETFTATCKKLEDNIKEYQNIYEEESGHYRKLNENCNKKKKFIADCNLNLKKMRENEVKVTEELEELEQNLQFKENYLKKLIEERSNSIISYNSTLPKVNLEYDMLKSNLPIRFDHTTPKNIIKGYILRSKNRDLIPFEFDMETNSQQFITNFLWEKLSTTDSFF